MRPFWCFYCWVLDTGADECKDGMLEFEEFVKIVTVPLKGSLEERLGLCFTLHDTASAGTLDSGDLYRALDATLRLYNVPLSRMAMDVKVFVSIVEASLPDAAKEGITLQDVLRELCTKPLLQEYCELTGRGGDSLPDYLTEVSIPDLEC
tara:strand:+ start:739 stop:1188 length:450 start_codon:yes stop_codon:yes gene_type:complete